MTTDQLAVLIAVCSAIGGILALLFATFALRDSGDAIRISAAATTDAAQAQQVADHALAVARKPLTVRTSALPTVRPAAPAPPAVEEWRGGAPAIERTQAFAAYKPRKSSEEAAAALAAIRASIGGDIPLRVRPGGPPAIVLDKPARPAVPTLLDVARRGQPTDADWLGQKAGAAS